MKTIAMVNPKGGAGKTVSAVNIAYVLSDRDKKVLLVDADARGAVSVYLGLENENNTLFDLIKEQYINMNVQDIGKYIREKNGVDIIVSNSEFHKFDSYFIFENNDYESLLDCIVNLKYLFQEYDYVIFDTEGTVNNLTRAVLKATDYIFSPSKSSAIDINGLADLLNMYEVSKEGNSNLEIRKIFLVQSKQNTRVFKETSEELKQFFDDGKFSEISVREDQNILNSMKEQKDIISFKRYSNAAIDYKNLVDEFLAEEREKE